MSVTVVTTADAGRRPGEDAYVEGDTILAFDGHFAVMRGGADAGTTLALYAPGTTADVDQTRSSAAPAGLGLRP